MELLWFRWPRWMRCPLDCIRQRRDCDVGYLRPVCEPGVRRTGWRNLPDAKSWVEIPNGRHDPERVRAAKWPISRAGGRPTRVSDTILIPIRDADAAVRSEPADATHVAGGSKELAVAKRRVHLEIRILLDRDFELESSRVLRVHRQLKVGPRAGCGDCDSQDKHQAFRDHMHNQWCFPG